MLTVGSLFAGIGGFDLGLERAGFEIKWQVEIDPFCRAVLAKHWPHVTRYDDVRTVGAELPTVDVLCGGFPCQPHSLAGRRGGSADERDLWPEFARIIRTVRPRWVVAENVPGLLSSESGWFFGKVLGDLAESGYDAEWDCLPASEFDAPHVRERVWIVAYPHENGCRGETLHLRQREPRAAVFNALGPSEVADADAARCSDDERRAEQARTARGEVADTDASWSRPFKWLPEPEVVRVVHGLSRDVDAVAALGNAIVPQIAEWIGRRIREAEERANGG